MRKHECRGERPTLVTFYVEKETIFMMGAAFMYGTSVGFMSRYMWLGMIMQAVVLLGIGFARYGLFDGPYRIRMLKPGEIITVGGTGCVVGNDDELWIEWPNPKYEGVLTMETATPRP